MQHPLLLQRRRLLQLLPLEPVLELVLFLQLEHIQRSLLLVQLGLPLVIGRLHLQVHLHFALLHRRIALGLRRSRLLLGLEPLNVSLLRGLELLHVGLLRHLQFLRLGLQPHFLHLHLRRLLLRRLGRLPRLRINLRHLQEPVRRLVARELERFSRKVIRLLHADQPQRLHLLQDRPQRHQFAQLLLRRARAQPNADRQVRPLDPFARVHGRPLAITPELLFLRAVLER